MALCNSHVQEEKRAWRAADASYCLRRTVLVERRRLVWGEQHQPHDSLAAGASGFLLKDVPPEQLTAGIRIVASGEALLAPSVTRRLIAGFVQGGRRRGQPPRELDELTPRELQVLELVAQGLSNTEIRESLVVEETTVKTHASRVLAKLGLRDHVQSAVLAYESGLVRGAPRPMSRLPR